MIKMVSVTTDQGVCHVNVESMPSFLRVSVSHELIEASDLDALSDVIARAIRAAFEMPEGEMKPIKAAARVTLKSQGK